MSNMMSSRFVALALNVSKRRYCTQALYEQGQSPEPKIREYFYFIDHQGQVRIAVMSKPVFLIICSPADYQKEGYDIADKLFMDDAKMKNFTSCFKEQKFLEFFFDKIEINETGRYEVSFPFMSKCGRERNYIRCDDRPVVFLDLLPSSVSYKPDKLTYGFAKSDKLRTSFQPDKLYMLPETGRVYHPADPEFGGVGLIKSSVAVALSKYFEFGKGENNPPTKFTWRGIRYDLTNEIAPLMNVPIIEARDMAVDLIAKHLQMKAPSGNN